MHIPFTFILVIGQKCATGTTQGLVVFHEHPPPAHVPVPHCKTHTAGKHKHMHTSNKKQLLLWVFLTWHTKLWFLIQCFWYHTSMNLRYQSSFEAQIAAGFQGSTQVFLWHWGVCWESSTVREHQENLGQRLFCQLHLTAQSLPPADHVFYLHCTTEILTCSLKLN